MTYKIENQATKYWEEFKTWVSDNLKALISKIESLAECYFKSKAEVAKNVNSPEYFNRTFKGMTLEQLIGKLHPTIDTAWNDATNEYSVAMFKLICKEIKYRTNN